MLYKLTDQDGYTRRGKNNELLWGPGVKHTATGPRKKTNNPQLCTDSFIHCYENPLIAVIMNPAHANIENPLLWEGKGFISKRDSQLKAGCFSFTTIRQIPLPKISNEQKVHFAIYCAKQVTTNKQWLDWAEKWLNREDRTYITAHAAAADAAAHAAYAANAAAVNAANAAAYAAYAATAYADAADAAYITADTAVYASTAYAAYTAAGCTKINFINLINCAMKEEN